MEIDWDKLEAELYARVVASARRAGVADPSPDSIYDLTNQIRCKSPKVARAAEWAAEKFARYYDASVAEGPKDPDHLEAMRKAAEEAREKLERVAVERFPVPVLPVDVH
ncbi:MAG: hypothetical protein MJD61_22390 [Proteobacteria bacterium]|nr:hypothetical protein [Pseudomonadota bacterium]